MKKIFVINTKTYKEASGKNAEKFAKICNKVESSVFVPIWLAVQPGDIFRCKKYHSHIIAQSIDNVSFGPYTGHILPENIKQQGAFATLINHSENPLSISKIKMQIPRARQSGLVSIVCVPSLRKAKKVSKLLPQFIAYEPKELISGKVSVSTAKPKLIKKIVNSTKIPVLIGAGIHSPKDVKKSVELGASGILVSSAIIKSKNPEKIIKMFAMALK